MQTWFNTPERIAALEAAATGWVGTPFVANSRVKGSRGGVSCQTLAEQLYIEAGYPVPFRVPPGPMRWCETHKDSVIEQFFDTQTEFFQSLEFPPAPSSPPSTPCSLLPAPCDITLPGDVLGFKIGGCCHHIGIALERGRFIHSMRGVGTQIYNQNDPTYAKRLTKIWRANP